MAYKIPASEAATAQAMEGLDFSGNLTPKSWFKFITHQNGRPDRVAMDLLSEIVYWNRPAKQSTSGTPSRPRAKFTGDKLQMSHHAFARMFNYSVKQVRDALKHLEELEFIDQERRTVETSYGVLYNVLFIGLNIRKLREITICISDGPSAKHGQVEARDRTGNDELTQHVAPNDLRVSGDDPQVQANDLQDNPPDIQVGPDDVGIASYTKTPSKIRHQKNTKIDEGTTSISPILDTLTSLFCINLNAQLDVDKLRAVAELRPAFTTESAEVFKTWWFKSFWVGAEKGDLPTFNQVRQHWPAAFSADLRDKDGQPKAGRQRRQPTFKPETVYE